MGKILKYCAIGILAAVIVAAAVAMPIVISEKKQGDKMYNQYAEYTDSVLKNNFELKPYTVKKEFRKLHPLRFLKLFKISVRESLSGDRLARVNSLDATMFFFGKMFTLMIRPDFDYNVPVLSVDIIFMGSSRVFIIEIIDPERIGDDNKNKYYDQMREWTPKVKQFEQSATRDWYERFLTDFSIHIKAKKSDDAVLFDIYKSYLENYVAMAQNAEPLSGDMSARMKQGLERYVDTLLSEGGPAVEVFKKMLGEDGQREYVRSVMFGLE